MTKNPFHSISASTASLLAATQETFLHSRVAEACAEHYQDAFHVMFGTIALTFVLEIWSIDTVKGLLSMPGGKELYVKSIKANLIHYILIGIPAYIVAAIRVRRRTPSSHLESALLIMGLLFSNSVQYYLVHRAFHASPKLYRYHKLHHRFNEYVPPSAGNAVSLVEYIVGYVAPFRISIFILPIDLWSLKVGMIIISVFHLINHTPKIEAITQKMLPSWWVSTHDHMEHHRKMHCHYSSPTFDIDAIFQSASDLLQKMILTEHDAPFGTAGAAPAAAHSVHH
eukprot:CAMPEP_0119561106 /NCGR_PEP_ID=MMETSP1352-20130426/16716_1 /TAXON_ID=265584 /ORGANISM="Stauroneis constricta, Strain CCMP1120" /LENGTH=282 /DNA_ID=CAMNT_0007609231 /DNA_START=20 /DNA_END=866 /DNA_ORIENTATION=+